MNGNKPSAEALQFAAELFELGILSRPLLQTVAAKADIFAAKRVIQERERIACRVRNIEDDIDEEGRPKP